MAVLIHNMCYPNTCGVCPFFRLKSIDNCLKGYCDLEKKIADPQKHEDYCSMEYISEELNKEEV